YRGLWPHCRPLPTRLPRAPSFRLPPSSRRGEALWERVGVKLRSGRAPEPCGRKCGNLARVTETAPTPFCWVARSTLLCRSKHLLSRSKRAASARPMPYILVDPDRRQHVLATHGHSHHRSTFLRRRCCPPTCQRHRHLPQLRQRAQRTGWTSLPGCRRLCHGFEPWACGVLLHPRVPRRRRRHKWDLNAWSLRAERGAHARCSVRLTAACLAFDRVDPVLLIELLRDTICVFLEPLTPACHA
ncbi:hypothetical protein Ctob_014135, partial [Chrysochromulina tobinii]